MPQCNTENRENDWQHLEKSVRLLRAVFSFSPFWSWTKTADCADYEVKCWLFLSFIHSIFFSVRARLLMVSLVAVCMCNSSIVLRKLTSSCKWLKRFICVCACLPCCIYLSTQRASLKLKTMKREFLFCLPFIVDDCSIFISFSRSHCLDSDGWKFPFLFRLCRFSLNPSGDIYSTRNQESNSSHSFAFSLLPFVFFSLFCCSPRRFHFFSVYGMFEL